MYIKPVQCSLYVYYGTFTHAGEISNILKNKRLSQDDFYAYIAQAGLMYRRIADEDRSKEIIVGKQLDYYQDFVAMKLIQTGEGVQMKHLNNSSVKLRLTSEEETEVEQKLLKLGFFPNCSYYMFHSYNSRIFK